MSDTPDTEMDPTESRSRRLNLSLSSLFLDPNNYRFIDHPDYRVVEEKDISREDVQRRTRKLLIGPTGDMVTDLIKSFNQNGWLDVEPIHVRKLAEKKFLVVEGNRRVATLKHIQLRWEDSTGHLGNLNPAIFKGVPCVLYEETSELHQLVVMGLHHISGKRRWPAINQARAMKRLRDSFAKTSDEICASLGVSKREFNLSIRTLALCDTYLGSDYGDQFKSDMFNVFREVLKAPALRHWLQWNDSKELAENTSNLERLFSWLSREVVEAEGEDDDHNASSALLGEPVITTGGQVRELAKIIADANAVKRLEETRSLQDASLSSDLLVKNEIDSAIERYNQDVSKLYQLAPKMSLAEINRVNSLTSGLDSFVSAQNGKSQQHVTGTPWPIYTDMGDSHFRTVRVGNYRAISSLQLDELGRVNLLVGINNAGKTSILEAIYLLAHQVDPRALLEVIRRRSRIDPELEPSWGVNQLPQQASLHAQYDIMDEKELSLLFFVKDTPENNDEDWARYLRSLVIEASCAGRTQKSVSDFFVGRKRRTQIDGDPHWLCPALLHSPFSLADPRTLARCNEASIRAKSKDSVIAFIRNHLDAGIRDIALADEYNRFLVTHTEMPEAVDLSWFGEGLQRVFQIGLLFAGARGGVVLIDEFENAIHTSVLIDFTRFIQELAIEFNVQVFITTHSKETVDAFLLNDYHTEDVVTYLLKYEKNEMRKILRFSGPELRRAVEVGDVDLRRM